MLVDPEQYARAAIGNSRLEQMMSASWSLVRGDASVLGRDEEFVPDQRVEACSPVLVSAGHLCSFRVRASRVARSGAEAAARLVVVPLALLNALSQVGQRLPLEVPKVSG